MMPTAIINAEILAIQSIMLLMQAIFWFSTRRMALRLETVPADLQEISADLMASLESLREKF